MAMVGKNEVRIPASISPYPEKHEITAAGLLADYFGADVHFVVRGYHKTADFRISGRHWELKSPTGNGKRTIQHTLQSALEQSPNIVIDARRSKMHIGKMKRELGWQLAQTRKIKRLLLITKTGDIVEFER